MLRRLGTIMIICLCPALCAAEIYKWTDEHGRLHFSNEAPWDAQSQNTMEVLSPGPSDDIDDKPKTILQSKARKNTSTNKSKGYYETGELQFLYRYVNGVREGITKEFYKSGHLKKEWRYKQGLLQGITKGYYETGELRYLFRYEKHKREGIAKEFYKSGMLKKEWIYKKGKLQ